MGNPFGPPNKPEYQRAILTTALELTATASTAGEIVDLKDTWPDDFTEKVTTSLLAMS